MSRNLAETACHFCNGRVETCEAPREITRADAGRYFEEFEGMIVAHATCVYCHAKYLAWIDETNRLRYPRYIDSREIAPDAFHDLSFRSTFDDEPGLEDFYEIDPRAAVAERHRLEMVAMLDDIASGRLLRDHPTFGPDEQIRERLEERERVKDLRDAERADAHETWLRGKGRQP